MRRQIQPVRALDEVEMVDRERHFAVAVDLARLELLEVGVGAVDTDAVGVEEAEAEHEVGDRFLRRHLHVDLNRFAALEHVAGFAIRAANRDVR